MNVFMNALQAKADEESAIIQLMCVFPAYYQYKSNPTSEQMKELVQEASKMGYTNLYHIFATGNVPSELDELIKRLAQRWRPSGEIVDSGSVVRQIEGKSE